VRTSWLDLERPPAKPCTFAECGRPFYARGLCAPHYQQHRAGRVLRPLRVRSSVAGYPRITVRVSPGLRAALGEHPSLKARAILEAWAKRPPSKW
jgi:hypothetical protein